MTENLPVNQLPKVDPAYQPSHFAEALKIRATFNQRLEKEPVYEAARKTLDTAEQAAPRAPFEKVQSVVASNANAMSSLKSTLGTIRSQHGAGFNESVPPADDENRLAGSIGLDSVQGASSTGAKTKATLNIRPHNQAAWAVKSKALTEEAGIKEENDEGKPQFIAQGKLRLNPNASQGDIDSLIYLLRMLASDGEKGDGDSDDFTVRTIDFEGAKHLYLTFVDREEDPDPLRKFLAKQARNFLDCYRGDEDELAVADSAPEFFRLLTATLEIPMGLDEFFNTDEMSWIKAIEAARVGFEVILRNNIRKHLYNNLSKGVLDSFYVEDIREVLGMAVSTSLAKDTTLKIKMAPIELLFGLLVKEVGLADRRMMETNDIPSDIRRKLKKDPEGARAFFDALGTTGPETKVANMVASLLQFGATSSTLKQNLIREFSRPILEGDEDGDEMPKMVGRLMTYFPKVVAGLTSGSIYTPSFHARVVLDGFNDSATNWFPKTPQDMVDAAKPLVLAASEGWDGEEEGKPEELSEGDCRMRKFWPRGRFEDECQRVIDQTGATSEQMPEEGPFVLISKPGARNSAFRIGVLVNSTDEEQSWSKVMTALGANMFSNKKEKKSSTTGEEEDEGDSDEDEEEMGAPPLPDADEGLMRCAYIKRPEGQNIEIVRLVSTTPASLLLLAKVDAVIVVDNVSEIDILSESNVETIGTFPKISVPVLFLSTSSSNASAETCGTIPEALFTPKTTRYQSFNAASASSATAASGGGDLISWCVDNSENPEKGRGSQPASAWDFARDDNLMLA